jgi:enterochelin esterase-like enzyme
MWCNSKDGKTPVESVVIQELLPHIDTTYRTIANREGRIIEGFSMGGYGAARLGFKYPDKFGAVSMLAGGPLDLQLMGPRAIANPEERTRILKNVYGGDIEYFKSQSPWVLAEKNAATVRGKILLRQVIGDRDFTLALNRAFDAHLTKLMIPHAFIILPNVAHDTMAVIDALGEKNWEFYRAAFESRVASKRKSTGIY